MFGLDREVDDMEEVTHRELHNEIMQVKSSVEATQKEVHELVQDMKELNKTLARHEEAINGENGLCKQVRDCEEGQKGIMMTLLGTASTAALALLGTIFSLLGGRN